MSLESLEDNGFTIIPSAISSQDCDAAVEAFYSFVSCNQGYSDGFLLKSGLHSRLANLHIWSETVRRVCLNPKVLDLCDEFLGSNAAICSSLYFEQGSEQSVHRDTPFFHTQPAKKFLGVWCALEDVDPLAGALFYYPGGHVIEDDLQALRRENPDREGERLYGPYVENLKKTLNEEGFKKESPDLKRGDVLIWHPELPHGGGPIAAEGTTRHSVVFHVIPENCCVFGANVFFDSGNPPPDFGFKYVPAGEGRLMLNHKAPAFAPNH